MQIVDLLTRFAATKNASPAQIALAWLLAQKPFIVSIPGTRNIDHLRENLGALDVQLTAADLSALDADFSNLTVHGGRMNDMQMRIVERAGYRRMIEGSVAKRAGTPDEVGAVGALLMGPDGGFITGSDFLMDGGVTAAYWFGEVAEVRTP